MTTTADDIKKFQEAGLKLAERQLSAVKAPLEPSSLTRKLVAEQASNDKVADTE